jgi:serine/threonine protein kinase
MFSKKSMTSGPTATAQDKINDILKKIDRERKLAEGASHLRKKTDNPSVIQKCNTQVREAQTNIEYLQSILRKLEASTTNGSNKDELSGNGNGEATSNVQGDNDDANHKSYNQVRQRPLFTALDLLKYDCPSLGHKIQYMMQMLEFKIQVETQYKQANEKMYNLYQVEGDKSSIALAQRGKSESDRKLQLMKRALKEYQSMYIDFDDVSRENAMINTVRKNPLSGVLFIQIQAIKNVDHIQSPLFSRNPECIISIKVDEVEKARTKGSRNDRWADFFDIRVDKANELSLTIYDRVNDQLIPVGLFWLSLSDISEEMRRKKVSQERITSEHWIDATTIAENQGNNNTTRSSSTSTMLKAVPEAPTAGHRTSPATDASSHSIVSGTSPVRSSGWFGLEPSGEILLTFGFVKTTESKTRTDHNNFATGLGRHGAIRQRKEDVIESQGHKLVQKQFYNIMSCAVCNEFLRYTGFQCEDCLFLCHQKCIKNIIAKCISKSNSDYSNDDNKLNHRIPHRFSPVTNRGAKWCCHCGYILPFGKKNVRKCDECGIMCHANCVHYVPDLCGMSPKTIEKILETLRISQHKANNKKKVNATVSSTTNATTATSPSRLMMNKAQLSPVANLPAQHKTLPELPVVNHLEKVDTKSSVSTADTKYNNNNYQNELSKVPTSNTISATELKMTSPYREKSKQSDSPIEEQYPAVAITRNEVEKVRSIEGNDGSLIPAYKEEEVEDMEVSKNADLSYRNSTLAPSEVVHPAHQQSRDSHRQHRQSHHHHHHQKRRHRRRYGLDDYKFISVLGKGNFGKVMLAEYVSDNRLCAIKVLKKNFIVENDEVESTKSEKKVFLVANKHHHPFLLNLYQCFQTENRIYFVMEYISGGDLMWHVQQKKFSLKRAQFYASEILLALKFLHENGIIYRDLKLDNIMLTVEGHIKLADYGLCKENMWYGKTTRTFCGTPELMAPEIISGEQVYDKAVDWWAFGVLLYQMILTKTPFKGDDEEEVFNAILTDEPLYPISMSKEAVDIIQKLLTRDPKLRLGSTERDAEEIMEHPYFADVDFEAILNLDVNPPYQPEVNDPRDPKCFEEEFTSQAAKLTPVNSILSPKMQEMFRGFTYSCEDDV